MEWWKIINDEVNWWIKWNHKRVEQKDWIVKHAGLSIDERKGRNDEESERKWRIDEQDW